MNLCCPPQFLWLFQTCEVAAPDFYNSQNLKDSINSLYTENWNNPSSSSGKQLSNSDLYMHIALFVFGIRNQDNLSNVNAVDILHQNGYFIRYSNNLFTTEFSIQNYLSITECLMWAYLDRHLPQNEMLFALGNLRSSFAHDSEACICKWINAIVSKHSRLPQLNVIGKHFFGLPYFRIILYHFTKIDELMNNIDTNTNNAKISFDFCNKNQIVLPFDVNKVEQPPLCTLCFFCNAIKVLIKLKIDQKSSPVITDSVVVKKLNGIHKLRNEVNQLTIRCNKLSDEVNFYSKLVKSRPQSAITQARPIGLPSIIKKHQFIAKPIPRVESGLRVSWDPIVMKQVENIKSRVNRENDPNNM